MRQYLMQSLYYNTNSSQVNLKHLQQVVPTRLYVRQHGMYAFNQTSLPFDS